MRILLIEDDAKTAHYVRTGLSEAGHVVDVIADGREGVTQAMGQDYDVLILDRMLPYLDGLSIAKTVRAARSGTPILFLTALGSINERVEGLDIGDDYLVKPFAFSELLARVNALGRRPALRDQSGILQVGDLVLDTTTRLVTRGGTRIELQQKEFTLLEFLMLNKGRVVTRTMLLERVWDLHFDPRTSVVETHISRLRGKIDRPFDKALLQTVRGTGYMLTDAS